MDYLATRRLVRARITAVLNGLRNLIDLQLERI